MNSFQSQSTLTASIPSCMASLRNRSRVLGDCENIEAIQREGYALVRGYLEAHRDEIDVADLDLAAFVLVTVVEALTHAAVLRRPDILSDGKARQFVDDVTRLVVRYLRTS